MGFYLQCRQGLASVAHHDNADHDDDDDDDDDVRSRRENWTHNSSLITEAKQDVLLCSASELNSNCVGVGSKRIVLELHNNCS